MWTVLAACIISFFGTCNAGRQATNGNNGDTILLYKKDTLLIANTVAAVFPCLFAANAQELYDIRSKTLLLLDNPTVTILPDGVFEVYVTLQPTDSERLSSSQPSFVNVLDLYSLTADGASKVLTVDISQQIKKIFLTKQTLPPLYITIRFGGTILPDGSSSSLAGEIKFSGFSIVQSKDQ